MLLLLLFLFGVLLLPVQVLVLELLASGATDTSSISCNAICAKNSAGVAAESVCSVTTKNQICVFEAGFY